MARVGWHGVQRAAQLSVQLTCDPSTIQTGKPGEQSRYAFLASMRDDLARSLRVSRERLMVQKFLEECNAAGTDPNALLCS